MCVFYDGVDVAYLEETTLLDELHYIEQDQQSNNIRLSQIGR
jgi:hypothetical protein